MKICGLCWRIQWRLCWRVQWRSVGYVVEFRTLVESWNKYWWSKYWCWLSNSWWWLKNWKEFQDSEKSFKIWRQERLTQELRGSKQRLRGVKRDIRPYAELIVSKEVWISIFWIWGWKVVEFKSLLWLLEDWCWKT